MEPHLIRQTLKSTINKTRKNFQRNKRQTELDREFPSMGKASVFNRKYFKRRQRIFTLLDEVLTTKKLITNDDDDNVSPNLIIY